MRGDAGSAGVAVLRPDGPAESRRRSAGRRGSSEDDLPLQLNRAPDRGAERGLNSAPDERRPAGLSMTEMPYAAQQSRLCKPDELLKAAMNGRLRGGRTALQAELTERQRRMGKPQPGELLQLLW
jgi:hypothetical protein